MARLRAWRAGRTPVLSGSRLVLGLFQNVAYANITLPMAEAAKPAPKIQIHLMKEVDGKRLDAGTGLAGNGASTEPAGAERGRSRGRKRVDLDQALAARGVLHQAILIVSSRIVALSPCWGRATGLP